MTEQQPPQHDPEQIHQNMQQGYPAAPPPPPGYGQAAQTGWGQPGTGGYGAPYAEWIKRVGGYLVDVLVIIPAYIVMIIGTAFMGVDNGAANTIGVFLYILGIIGAIGIAVWNQIIRQGQTGWSIGKQVIGIRLIGEQTGQPIGPGLTFVRMLAHILDSLACYVGWLWPLWDQKRQTFADKIMTTVVIEQKKP